MPRQAPIKWRQSDLEKLRKQVKRFNDKIYRAAKKNPDIVPYLPERLSVKRLRNDIKTRKGFNNALAYAERFMRRDALKVVTKGRVTGSKFQFREAQNMIQRVNAVRKKEREAIKARVGEKEFEYKYKRDYTLHNKKRDFSNTRNLEWDSFLGALRKQADPEYFRKKEEQLKRNWVAAAYKELGDLNGSVLYNIVKQIPAHEFARLHEANEDLEIDYIYGAEQQAVRFTAILNLFQKLGYNYDKPRYVPYGHLFEVEGGFNKLLEVY